MKWIRRVLNPVSASSRRGAHTAAPCPLSCESRRGNSLSAVLWIFGCLPTKCYFTLCKALKMCDFNLLFNGCLLFNLAFYNEIVHGMSHVFPCVVFISVVYRTLGVTVNLWCKAMWNESFFFFFYDGKFKWSLDKQGRMWASDGFTCLVIWCIVSFCELCCKTKQDTQWPFKIFWYNFM